VKQAFAGYLIPVRSARSMWRLVAGGASRVFLCLGRYFFRVWQNEAKSKEGKTCETGNRRDVGLAWGIDLVRP